MKLLCMFTSLLLILVACSNTPGNDNKGNAEANHFEKISCDSLLKSLVKSTGEYPNQFNWEANQDGVSNDTLLIKVSHENEAEPGAYVDAADGFLSIDLKSHKLYVLNIETNTLVHAKYDESMLDYYIKHCIH
jgi:hypothetical protein